MAQAKITMAGTKADNTAFGPTAGSQLDAKINSVVNLDNLNAGGELTFTWSILDQPPGAADSLSSVSAQNPFFTPKKEGSYLLRLIVNQSLPTEQEDRVVLAVAQLKTRERMPAAGETNESDTSDGWAVSMNSLLRRVDTLLSDPGIIVGVNGSGGTLNRGQVVRAPATDIIKGTLPGQETVPSFTTVTAATLSTIDELLCIVEGTPSGLPGVPGVGSAENRLMKVRYIGRIGALPIAGPAPTAGDVLFVNDAGAVSSVQGTIRRRIGSSMTTGSPADVWFNGVGGADIDLPSIAEPYVTNGPSALPNAFRIDGANASARTAAMGPFEVHTGDAVTPTTRWRRFSSLGASIGEWTTEAGVPLVRVTATGQLVIEVGAGGLFVNSVGVTIATSLPLVQTPGSTTVGFTLDNAQVQLGRRQLKFSNDDGFGNFYSNYMEYTYLGGLSRRGMQFVNQTADGTSNIKIEGQQDGFGGVRGQLVFQDIHYISSQQGNLYLNQFGVGNTIAAFTTAGTFQFISSSTLLWQVEGFINGGALVGAYPGGSSIRTNAAAPLRFGTNNADTWELRATGTLAALGGNRFISNVLDPVLNQDAATKRYIDYQNALQESISRNYISNGDFEIWQRVGISTTEVTEAKSTLGLSVGQYRADRWRGEIEITLANGASITYGQSQQNPSFGLWVQRLRAVSFTGSPTPATIGIIETSQEIDRGWCQEMRGKRVGIRVALRIGTSMFNYARIRIFANNGTGTSPIFPKRLWTGVTTTLLDQPIDPFNLFTFFVPYTYQATVDVPVDCTAMQVAIGREVQTNLSSFDANDYLDVTQVMLMAMPVGWTWDGGFPPNVFKLAFGDRVNELAYCQGYFEKSSPRTIAPNAIQTTGVRATASNGAGANIVATPGAERRTRSKLLSGFSNNDNFVVYSPATGALHNVFNENTGADAPVAYYDTGVETTAGLHITSGVAVGDALKFNYTSEVEI